MIRRIIIVCCLAAVLGGVAAVFAASRLQGDTEVLNDIDQHFEALETTAAPKNIEPSENTVLFSAAAQRDRPVQPKIDDELTKSRGKKKSHRDKGKSKKGAKKKSKSHKDTGFKGIREVAPGTYVVDAALVADARQNFRKYSGRAGAVGVVKKGKLIGFKIIGISKKSALHAIGLRNGDVLTAVNGYVLNSVDNALLAATALRFAQKYRVDLLRGKKALSFYYRVGSKTPK